MMVKLCKCGCGAPVPLACYTDRCAGWVKGKPRAQFVHGHNGRASVSSRLKKHSKQDHATGCRVWTASCSAGGYGMVNVGGKPMPAHRAAWIQAKGPIPEGLNVCHKCDNRPCIEVSHLFLGTNADNMQDMARKGRSGITPKLRVRQVKAIRAALARGVQGRKLAKKYSVSEMTVSAIKTRRTWQQVVA